MLRFLAVLICVVAGLSGPALSQAPAEYNPYQDFVISEDLAALPEPVRKLREQLIAAARSGDIAALRPIIEAQKVMPRFSFGDIDDPIDYLIRQSGDPNGRTILAILLDILDAPYGVLGASSDQPIYIWPYLAGMSDFSNLTPAQEVDALRIVTWPNFQDVQAFGGWFYWRTLISKDGAWQAFVAGD